MPISATLQIARPDANRQGDAVLDGNPQLSLHDIAGGSTRLNNKGQVLLHRDARRTKKTPLKIMHWNAEGVNSKRDGYSKKLELENLLHVEGITVCCLQETHLNTDIAFKI